MTSRDFAYWLQGFFEISGTNNLDVGQVEMIKRHLNLVFKHEIDPTFGDNEKQEVLNQIHEGKLQGPPPPQPPPPPFSSATTLIRC
jgi:hypothetical protein